MSFLGLALALAPVGAWLAVKGLDVSALEILQMLVLAAAVVLWLVGFDIIYALQDYEFDRTHGLHSLVVAWGPKNALQAAFLAHWSCAGCCSPSGCSAGSASPTCRLADHRRLPGAGTLDRPPPQPQLDQRGLLPPQRRRQRRLPGRDCGRGRLPGRFPPALASPAGLTRRPPKLNLPNRLILLMLFRAVFRPAQRTARPL